MLHEKNMKQCSIFGVLYSLQRDTLPFFGFLVDIYDFRLNLVVEYSKMYTCL